jgi:hypothetical protein
VLKNVGGESRIESLQGGAKKCWNGEPDDVRAEANVLENRQ